MKKLKKIFTKILMDEIGLSEKDAKIHFEFIKERGIKEHDSKFTYENPMTDGTKDDAEIPAASL